VSSYESFACVYDLFMSDTPYDDWCEYLHGLLLRCGVADGLILELGCGTGAMTGRLSRLGYDMIGVDNSVDMLEIAREKQLEQKNRDETDGGTGIPKRTDHSEKEPDILYLLQDMRGFELYGTVRAVVSVCDSMNYITEESDLLQVFRLVNNYLDPGGVFIFDLNTPYKYEEILAENVFAENREEGSFIWENWYDPATRINEYDLTLYIRRDEEGTLCPGSLYERYEETHYQMAWQPERVWELLKKAGLKPEAVYDAFTMNEPNAESERVYFIARETAKRQEEIPDPDKPEPVELQIAGNA